MEATSKYINEQLNKAQALLWGGSETENIEAHNLIASLIKHLETKIKAGKVFTNSVNSYIIYITTISLERGSTNGNKA